MFTWKKHKDIFKGEGIYHLTFAVQDREPILGTLVQDQAGTQAGETPTPGTQTGAARAVGAHVQLSPIGRDISRNIQDLPQFFPAIKVCAKLLMPDHIHVVLWVQTEQPQSIKEVARSMRQAWHKIILTHTDTYLPMPLSPSATQPPTTTSAPPSLVSISPQIQSAGNNNESTRGQDESASAGNEDGQGASASTPFHLPYRFETPYIRTLVRKGQLTNMINYIHDNPRRAMLKRLNPDLFRLRREVQACGLTFTALGNLFLLDYPQRQAVICSRSASAESIAVQQAATLQAAETGTITYSGAISAGERQITRAIREAGFPLVVLLNEGFPAEGSEQEQYYKPGGLYFEACAAGRLLLLEATKATMQDPRLVSLTEQALRDKAEAKHLNYEPLPHASKRWRMMANNTIVQMLTGQTPC